MRKIKQDSGMVIVEATFVFPIMFLVIFLMLFTGNVYMQKCRVEAIVNEYALNGAAYCADPLLKATNAKGSVPEKGKIEISPYRYIFGGMNDIENEIQKDVIKNVGGLSTGLFSGMKPKNYSDIKAKYHANILCSSFSIDLNYKIVMPVKMLFSDEPISIKLSAHADVPVSDTTEFIRNVNMAEDILEATGIKEKISETIDKMKEMFGMK